MVTAVMVLAIAHQVGRVMIAARGHVSPIVPVMDCATMELVVALMDGAAPIVLKELSVLTTVLATAVARTFHVLVMMVGWEMIVLCRLV